MENSNDLDSIRQLSIKEAVRKRSDFAAPNRFFEVRIQIRRLPDASAGVLHSLDKLLPNSNFLFFIKPRCIC